MNVPKLRHPEYFLTSFFVSLYIKGRLLRTGARLCNEDGISINFSRKCLGSNVSKTEVPKSFVNELRNYILYR